MVNARSVFERSSGGLFFYLIVNRVMALINELAKVLQRHYQSKVNESKAILSKDRRNASGRLSASLRPIDTVLSPTVATLELIAEEHWKFIDKGVKGWANEKAPTNSPFQFKKKRIPIAVLTGAGGWIANKGLVKSGKNAKGENFALGKVFSASIPKKGIRATEFITGVFNEKQVSELKDELAKAHKAETIKQLKNGNND